MQPDDQAEQLRQSTGSTGVRTLLGCLLFALAASCTTLTFFGYWLFKTGLDEIDFAIEMPREVAVDEPFELTVVLKNLSHSETVWWTGVEVSDSYEDQCQMLTAEPPWHSVDYYSGIYVYQWDAIEVAPRSESRVTFVSQADRSGEIVGEIGIVMRARRVPSNFSSRRTKVHAKAVGN